MTYQFTEEKSRIVVKDTQGNEVGEVTYSKAGENILIIDHTGVDDAHRGQGLAAKLVYHVVEKAKKENLKIMPLCPFAKNEFIKESSYREVQHQ